MAEILKERNGKEMGDAFLSLDEKFEIILFQDKKVSAC